MLQCPACSNITVPGWRQFFSRQERFKCPGCSVWLRFRKEHAPPGRFLSGIRNIWIRIGVIALGLQAVILFCIVAMAYASCYMPRIPNSVLVTMLLIGLGTMIGFSERSILKRQRLAVAERQDGRPSLDGVKDLAEIAKSSEGRQFLLSMVLFLVLMFGGMATWRPILAELRRVLPTPVCQPSIHPSR